MRLLRWLKPSLIDRYILREIIPFTFLGLFLFTFVLLLPQLAELMAFLVSRGADPMTVLRIFWNFLPRLLALTIPCSMLLGVLLAFGRMGSESEVVALRAGGVGPGALLRPVLAVGMVGSLVTLYITAFGYPNANRNFRELTYSLVASKAQTAIRPRVVTDDLLPSFTIYASDVIASTGEWRDLLIRDSRDSRKPRVVLARGGRLFIDQDAGEARLELEQGAIHTFAPSQPDVWEEQRFQSSQLPLPFRELIPARMELTKGTHEMTLPEVITGIAQAERVGAPPTYLASLNVEWHKRFSIAAACLVFGLLGAGLSFGQKREARSAAFGLSIAAIFIYYVFLLFGERFGDAALVPALPAMWTGNFAFGAVATWLLVLNQRVGAFDPLDPGYHLAWLSRLRRRTPPPGATTADVEEENRPAARRPIRLWSLLDGYVASSYAGQLFLTAAAFWSLTVLIEFMELVDDIYQNHVAWSVLFKYLLFQGPYYLTLILPVAFLVATLTTLGLMARRNEITAMKAGGISVYRVAVPVVALAFLGSLALFGLGEFVAPYTNRVAQREKDVIKGRPAQSVRQFEERIVLGKGRGRFYELTSQASTPNVLYNVSVYDVDPESWTLREYLFAAQARWNRYGGFYDLERGWRRVLAGGSNFRPFGATRTREIEPPDYFHQEAASADTLGIVELREHIQTLAAMGMDVIRLRVDLHRKLALPAVAIVMALLGIPFSFVVGRRGALYGIGVALLLAIVYWSCVKIFEGLGVNALLPPSLAMWAPNILFAGTAVYLLLCLDT